MSLAYAQFLEDELESIWNSYTVKTDDNPDDEYDSNEEFRELVHHKFDFEKGLTE